MRIHLNNSPTDPFDTHKAAGADGMAAPRRRLLASRYWKADWADCRVIPKLNGQPTADLVEAVAAAPTAKGAAVVDTMEATPPAIPAEKVDTRSFHSRPSSG